MINNWKMHQIVQYINQSEFEFEVDEVIHDIESILAGYGILELSTEEYLFLMAELLPLAEEFEFREAAHLALQEDPLIALLPERHFSLKIEAIQRKLAKPNTHQENENIELAVA